MSCSGNTSTRGRAAAGIMSGQQAGDYPLVAPSDDISMLLADMYLAYDDSAAYDPAETPKKHPLRIVTLSGAGCLASTANIKIVDAHNTVVFDSATAPSLTRSVVDWSADYKIYEWRTPGPPNPVVCRIVVYKTWPQTDKSEPAGADSTSAKTYEATIVPASAVIDERAVHRMPKRLFSLNVRNANITTNKFSGNIVLKNGYNTEISATPATISNFRQTAQIKISGTPGSGLGKFFNCGAGNDDYADIVTINGVAPRDTGDFLLGAKDCLWVTRPTILTEENELVPSTTAGAKFGGDCQACCSCEDYANTALYMNQVAYRYQLIGQRAQEVYTQHETNVANWSNFKCAVGEKLNMVTRTQQCGTIDFAITLCNTCDTCTPAATLLVELYVPPPEDRPVPSTGSYTALGPETGNYGGNVLVHDIDCRFTNTGGSTPNALVDIYGNYAKQFGSASDPYKTIDAVGNDVANYEPVSTDFLLWNRNHTPQKSFIWPTWVPNIFVRHIDENEPYSEETYANSLFAIPNDYSGWQDCRLVLRPEAGGNPFLGNMPTDWDMGRNLPPESWPLTWAGAGYGYRYYDDPAASLYQYGIPVADCPPIPTTENIKSYLAFKYELPPVNSTAHQLLFNGEPEDPEAIDWSYVGDVSVFTNENGDEEILEPDTHNKWWAPLEAVNFGNEQINGSRERRVYEMINEAQLGAILATPSAVSSTLERLSVDPAAAGIDVNNVVMLGATLGDFENDVLPRPGLYVVDAFGLFGTWMTDGMGYFPAKILKVYTEQIYKPPENIRAGSAAGIVWVVIAKPTTRLAAAGVSNPMPFPAISVDFNYEVLPDPTGTEENPKTDFVIVTRSVTAQTFRFMRFYDMNFFSAHIKMPEQHPKYYIAPYVEFRSLSSLKKSTRMEPAARSVASWYNKRVGRGILARTPRRVLVRTPEVSVGSTLQVDFRVTLQELEALAYVSKIVGSPLDNIPTEPCDDNFPSPSTLEVDPLSPHTAAISLDTGNLTAIEDWFANAAPGKDDMYYVHIPAPNKPGSATSSFADLRWYDDCDPTIAWPSCPYASAVPLYWTLLRWKKVYDETVVAGAEIPIPELYTVAPVCPDAGTGLGPLTPAGPPRFLPAELTNTAAGSETNEAGAVTNFVRQKLCAYEYATQKPYYMTRRQVPPRSDYEIEIVLTGTKPTANKADLSNTHIIDDGCPGDPDIRKAIIKDKVRLRCNNLGQTWPRDC